MNQDAYRSVTGEVISTLSTSSLVGQTFYKATLKFDHGDENLLLPSYNYCITAP